MTYPNIAICELHTTKLPNDLFNIDKLEDYIPQNPLVHKTHSHNFYHLAYIKKGSGKHVIDFQSFEVSPQTIYFMKPHQVHHWEFSDDTTGYVINFSTTFLDSNFIQSNFLHTLPLFHFGNKLQMVYQLNDEAAKHIENLLELIYTEQGKQEKYKQEIIAQQLSILLFATTRYLDVNFNHNSESLDKHQELFNQFEQLLEANYAVWKLPKEYAQALHITPSLLQIITQKYANQSAGNIIRERILLESKRLLVNKTKTISEIAYQLNFADNSYFSKFFKKYTDLTPEQFRSQY